MEQILQLVNTPKVYAIDTTYGDTGIEWYLVPFQASSEALDLCQTMLVKWAHRFNYLCLYSQGNSPSIELYLKETPQHADEPMSLDVYILLRNDTEILRKSGVFSECYPNSSVTWGATPPFFLPIGLNASEIAWQRKRSFLQRAKEHWTLPNYPNSTETQLKEAYDVHAKRIETFYNIWKIADFRVNGKYTHSYKFEIRYDNRGSTVIDVHFPVPLTKKELYALK